MLPLKRTLLALCFAIAAPLTAVADTTFSGQAVRVLDGDTIEVLKDSRELVRIRLANIDAPEKTQPFGQKSKQNLISLVAGKDVKIIDLGGDQYGRRIGRVMVGADEANVEQVKAGMAWVYERYNHDPKLPAIEASARAHQSGLWQDKSPQAPWTFRHGQ
ncbi:thermonuclease family protein [Pseudomonas sp. UMAB-40]|uniref:thermonuclease family protein n=1 Tax=Pseudomonas sp. UMAB-40 TaxID=1365407 RepID=UPI001C594602|nr:thermonuclease family protein [Pseudomonas sp. UMAB-40]